MASNLPKPPSDVPVATIEHDMTRLESFVDENRKRLLWAAIGIVLLICAFIVFKFRAHQAEVEAHGAFTGAETVEELRDVMASYSDGVVAGSAQLLLADKLWEEGKREESLSTLKSFVDTREDHPLYYKAMSDLGAHEHIRGNLARAIELQQEVASGDAQVFVQQVALLRLGDAHTARALEAQVAGDAETAEEHFEQARIAFEELESRAGESMKRLASARKQRLPILRVPAEPAPEAEADSPADEATSEEAVPEIPERPAEAGDVTPAETDAEVSEPAESADAEVPEPEESADAEVPEAEEPADVEVPESGEGD